MMLSFQLPASGSASPRGSRPSPQRIKQYANFCSYGWSQWGPQRASKVVQIDSSCTLRQSKKTRHALKYVVISLKEEANIKHWVGCRKALYFRIMTHCSFCFYLSKTVKQVCRSPSENINSAAFICMDVVLSRSIYTATRGPVGRHRCDRIWCKLAINLKRLWRGRHKGPCAPGHLYILSDSDVRILNEEKMI